MKAGRKQRSGEVGEIGEAEIGQQYKFGGGEVVLSIGRARRRKQVGSKTGRRSEVGRRGEVGRGRKERRVRERS